MEIIGDRQKEIERQLAEIEENDRKTREALAQAMAMLNPSSSTPSPVEQPPYAPEDDEDFGDDVTSGLEGEIERPIDFERGMEDEEDNDPGRDGETRG